MNDRIFYIGFGGACLILMLFIGRNAVSDPLDAQRQQFADSLSRNMVSAGQGGPSEEVKQLTLERTIVGKKSAWTDLVPPPPPPPPPPPKPVTCPDVNAMLSEVAVTRMQIGDAKVKVIHPGAPNGEWLTPGTALSVPFEKGTATVTLVSFTRSDATFSYFCAEKNQTLKATIPRE